MRRCGRPARGSIDLPGNADFIFARAAPYLCLLSGIALADYDGWCFATTAKSLANCGPG